MKVNSTEGSGSTFSFTIMVRIVCSNEKHHLRLTQLLQEEKGSIGDSTNVSSKLFQSEAPPVVLSQSDDLPKPMIFDRRQYNLKILLAEDNFVNQTVAVALLKREGYQNVDIVANGQQAIDALDKKHYDIVLMDLHMPVMDGLTSTKLIREKHPGNKHSPYIIGLSANVQNTVKDKCLSEGMNDFLGKPITSSQLNSAIMRHLNFKN
eukprot:TRINITY_DN1823_c0_g1_i6.p1 TRINITY_DN1823_c0_g1~~TRINITY_DN1823_c0_g1_i6.p1  ORF type:complete len:207 (-),score=22.35 TRINITY_DN1823_c0_g1_i6:61-681(-)